MPEPVQPAEIEAKVFAMRERGAPWLEIQRALGLTRQQARHAYQRALREERRAQKKNRQGPLINS